MTPTPCNRKELESMRHLFQLMLRRLGLLQKESSQCCGVTLVQSHILYEIKSNSQLTLNELAEKLNLNNSTTSRHIQGLVEQELVNRQPDSQDRRYVSLSLTNKGETLEEEIGKLMMEHLEDILNHLPPSKIPQIYEDLHLLMEAIKKSNYCCRLPGC